jgi:hypothetical protein
MYVSQVAVIAEGYFDVIALHGAGVRTCSFEKDERRGGFVSHAERGKGLSCRRYAVSQTFSLLNCRRVHHLTVCFFLFFLCVF